MPIAPHCTCGYPNGGRDSDRPRVACGDRRACVALVAVVPRTARARGGPGQRRRRSTPPAWAQAAPARGRARRRLRARSSTRASRAVRRPGRGSRGRRPRSRSSSRRPPRCCRYGPTGTLDTSAVSAAGIGRRRHAGRRPVLVGGGDPTFGSRAIARRTTAATRRSSAWPSSCAPPACGACTGTVFGDESAFDALRGGPTRASRVDPYVGAALGAARPRPDRRAAAPTSSSPPPTPRASWSRRSGPRASASRARRPPAPLRPAPGAGHGQLAADGHGSSRLTNRPSDNFLPRCCSRAWARGSAAAALDAGGRHVVEQTIAEIGVAPHVVDGSGLSRATRPRPTQVVRAARRRMHRRRRGGASAPRCRWPAAPARCARRMRGTAAAGRCQAKTGTLSNVSRPGGLLPRPPPATTSSSP